MSNSMENSTQSNATLRVGLIGLGVMGRPMGLNLLKAGFPLTVWARSPQSAAPLLAAGADWAETPAALATRVEVVITIVTTGDDVCGLVAGRDGIPGLRERLPAGAVHVDMSTIPPATARQLAADWAGQGVAFIDAPVSGGEQGAIHATLAIMAGGSAAGLERLRPLFMALGKTLVHIGEAGAGQVAKMCNQHIMVSALQAVAEAMHLANAAGVDAGKVKAALAGGSAGSRVLEVMGERMVQRDFAAGIEARLHHKDFAIVLAEARQQGVPMLLGAQVWQQLNALMGQDWGKQDTSSLLKVLEAQDGRAP